MRKVLLSLAVLLGATTLGTETASAASPPPDLNGARISWSSQLPCDDGAGGTYVSTRPLYNMPSAGTYRMRVGLYRSSDDGRIALGPLGQYTSRAAGWVYFMPWSYSTAYTGNTYVVAYVYKLQANGTYALVAREWVSCV